jgi:hypothetical protein
MTRRRGAWGNLEEEREECEQNNEDIFRALCCIDEARADLMHAQNILARVLRESHPIKREEFSAFYTAGGVTSEDWLDRQVFLRGEKQEPIGHGQVRLVRQRRKKQGPPPRAPRGGRLVAEDDDAELLDDMGNGPWAA